MKQAGMLLTAFFLVFLAHAALTEEYPTCDCWTPECGYCSKLECTVKQTSNLGITVSSKLRWKKQNTIVLFDDAGAEVGRFRLSLRGISLSGCSSCHTPGPLKRARTRGGPTQWAFSLGGGSIQIAIKGQVLYSQKMGGRCAEKYGKATRFAFYNMGCENTFSYVESEMELGALVSADCGGACSK
ncbi:uncharacterized protein LOC134824080 [Bolinopsis microptera]|uniref:uncharacterized protein LOC134824080 n=1 Tax=Bolinopsis microptera TaxID=2820187 RepID=UPI0030792B1E